MDHTDRDTPDPPPPRWRVAAANLDAPLRRRRGELVLTDGLAEHRASDGSTTGTVDLTALVTVTGTIDATADGERQTVELSTAHERLRLGAPVELVLAALRSARPDSLVVAAPQHPTHLSTIPTTTIPTTTTKETHR